MSGSATPAEARIEQLEQIEDDVIAILKTAGNCLVEIAKDRPSQKAVDTNVQQVRDNSIVPRNSTSPDKTLSAHSRLRNLIEFKAY